MPKKRADTVEFDPKPVLDRMARQEAPTMQLDADAVKRAAAECAEATPRRRKRATPAVIRREQPTRAFRTVHRPADPFAEIAVVGGGDIYALPLRQLSHHGLAVAAAAEQAPLLVPGVNAVVSVTLNDGAERIELRLHARVEHRRDRGRASEGGVRLRWTETDGAVGERIGRLVAAWSTLTART